MTPESKTNHFIILDQIKSVIRLMAGNPLWCAGLLVVLALLSLTSPAAAIASMIAASAFVFIGQPLRRARNPVLTDRAEAVEIPEDQCLRLGISADNHAPLFIDPAALRGHVVAVGSLDDRGAVTSSLMREAIRLGRGLMFCAVDGMTVGREIVAAAHDHGREDDLVMLDFMSTKSPFQINPFEFRSAHALCQMILHREDIRSVEGAEQRFAPAEMLLRAAMGVLVERRDTLDTPFGTSDIEAVLGLSFVVDKIATAEAEHQERFHKYAETLSGWDLARGHHQSQATLEHHSSVVQLLLGLLVPFHPNSALTAGHGEVDLLDVIQSGRIVIAHFPSAEGVESRDLTAAMMPMVYAAVVDHLGAMVKKGTFSEIMKFQTSATDFMLVLEGGDRFLPPRMALFMVQARSLGITMITALDDLRNVVNEHTRQALVGMSRFHIVVSDSDSGSSSRPDEVGFTFKFRRGTYRVRVPAKAKSRFFSTKRTNPHNSKQEVRA